MLTLAWRLPEKPQEESADDQRICQLMLLEGGSDSDREEASARVGTPRDSSGMWTDCILASISLRTHMCCLRRALSKEGKI